jgi:UDP-glucose 4-epimerase
MDVADGHAYALRYIENGQHAGNTYSVFNLGSGHGYSVLDMVEAMHAASGRPIPYEFAPRRSGDIAICYADTTKAARELGWTAKRELPEMCRGNFIHFLFLQYAILR